MNVLNMAQKGNFSYMTANSDNKNVHEKHYLNNRQKVIASSAIGSALGITYAVSRILKGAKKGNPYLELKNLTYSEKDMIKIGAGSVLGGLTGGLIADNNSANTTPKLREASMQFFGSLLCPLTILHYANRALDNSGFRLPKFNQKSKLTKHLNVAIEALPKVAVTLGSLVLGMNIGNKIMNKVNNTIFEKKEHRHVHASDYLVHTDDACIAASLLLKDSKSISAITSRILPASFILAGAKSGVQQG